VNGAQSLVRTLIAAGVDLCFANPGTSEMHLVQAIDEESGMRPVLCLFEGVCTGAADGFGRMTGRPAATLLHLGVGLANGVANLHNARRAYTPLLNLVGNHSLAHISLDAPLTSDIESIARSCSVWTGTSNSADSLAQYGLDAVKATLTRRPGSAGQIATLIIPANCAWEKADHVLSPCAKPAVRQVDEAIVKEVAKNLDSDTLLILNGDALNPEGLRKAASVCAVSGARFCCATFPPRIDFAPGLPRVFNLPYLPEAVQDCLRDVRTLVLVGAEAPVTFFDYAYRNTPGSLVPEGTRVLRLSHQHEDSPAALAALAEYLGATDYPGFSRERPSLPRGELTVRGITQGLAALLPENAIVSVDSGGGGATFDPLQGIVPASWLYLTGGSIGQGGPVSVGAALACPERPVIALLGDGGAMYTNQSLWTQAREQLNVTTVIYDNAAYNILDVEYARLGINEPGARAASLFKIDNPLVDWVALAESMGVPGRRPERAEDFCTALEEGLNTPGPLLIDCRIG